jgi:hypothetical protein
MKSILVLLIVTVIAAGRKKRNIIGPEPPVWYVTKNDNLSVAGIGIYISAMAVK